MKNRLLTLIFAFLLVNSVNAQKCGSYDGYLEKQIQNYPDFYHNLEGKNQKLKAENIKALKGISAFKTENGKKIIPVVVHNIYNGTNGYLSDAVIQNAIDVLNRNINGQSQQFLGQDSDNNSLTPDIFASVRGVANIEFRLAKITPTCDTCTPKSTTGIVRINTEITSLGSGVPDPVKALSYWNSYQYLNIWTVPAFGGDAGGGLQGYAQFPNPNPFSGDFMSTDGIVLLSELLESNSNSTLTHEVGHWLGLRHIWGDEECGDDGIFDTPPQRYDNNGASLNPPVPAGHPFGNASNFPYHVGLINPNTGLVPWGCLGDSLNPAGEMFMNYMSYTESPTTMFSAGQIEVVNVTLEGLVDETTGISGFGYREYMWSPENNLATGTDGYFNLNDTCSTQYDFASRFGTSSCLNVPHSFRSNSNFVDLDITASSWDFGDGSTATGDINMINYTYDSVGTYDVTLIVEYNGLREVRASNINDLNPSWDELDISLYPLIVQGTKDELISMGATNISVHIDEDGYSLNSFWKKNQFSTDSILDASSIDTLQADSTIKPIINYINYDNTNSSFPDSVLLAGPDSIWILIDGNTPSSQDLLLLDNADSVWQSDITIGYLNTILDYNFYYDTTVLNILTFIDSTFLSAADSVLLDGADSSWSVNGVLASDSIKIYFAQFNVDSIITISINIDTTSLSASDSLMFNNADSSWSNVQSIIGSVDTIRSYYAQYDYYIYNGYFADTLFYRGELVDTTYIASYQSSCMDTIVKTDYMNISEDISPNITFPYAYSFESEQQWNSDWIKTQPQSVDSEWEFQSLTNTLWEWTSSAYNEGSASIMINRNNLVLGTAEIISNSYNLSDLDSPAIKFSWSGAASSNNVVNELKISYSTNCGRNWSPLGTIDAINSANAGMYVTDFIPEASQWIDTVMTKNQLRDENIKFKFEYVINGNSNNFYLDNILIGEESELMSVENTASSKLSIYPNPTREGLTSIRLNNLANKILEVKLVNILGAEVMHMFSGELGTNYPEAKEYNLSHLETGIYFVKVVAGGSVIVTDKLIVR